AATPLPFDLIMANRVLAGDSLGFAGATGAAAQGIDPGGGAPHTPVATSFPVTVAVDSRFTTLTDVDVELNLDAAKTSDLRIELVAPDGTVVRLMRNEINADGTDNGQLVGSGGGTNLGINANGFALGTVFDQEAVRNFVDPAPGGGRATTSPVIGHYRPDSVRRTPPGGPS